MHIHPRRLVAAAAALAAVGSLLLAPGAGAAPPEREQHCAVKVVGQRPSGELVVSEPECRARYADALAAVGARVPGTKAAQLRWSAQSSDFVIGTHYDGAGLTGSSFSVVGSNCWGGYLNLSTSWINRVSSTYNGCFRIRHFDGYDKSGAFEDTVGLGGNLGTLNNRANSIQYWQ